MSKKPLPGETARRALWLILAAVVLGAAVNLLHPKRIPWIEDWAHRVEAQAVAEKIPLTQLSDMLRFMRDGSHLFVDARPAEEYAKGHIPGAVSLSFEKLEQYAGALTQVTASPKPLVLYCTGPECDDSVLLALHLRKLGRGDVSVFIGGMDLWKAELLNIEEEPVQ